MVTGEDDANSSVVASTATLCITIDSSLTDKYLGLSSPPT